MSKQAKSVLDRYAEQLLEMDAAGKTLAEMLAWLKEEACTVSLSTISRWLESARSSAAQERILNLVATGSAQCTELDKAFAKNPAPELDMLIKLFKVLILKLTTQGQADTKLLQLADQLSRTAIEFINGQTKAAFKRVELEQAERKLQIIEKKAAAFDAAQKVAVSELTSEEKDAEYRRIFGMS